MSEGTQRRLAAIVAADVVGYSRLMGVDEAGTLAALRNHRAELIDGKIAEHGGRIVKTMGDGLLLEFPSVVDATQCVIDVQVAMAKRNEAVDEDKRIVFRIGVHLGDLVVEGDDIFGDGINVAARLEAFCEAGGVAISGTAHENIAGRIEVGFIGTGDQQLKNITRPVRVWQWTPTTNTIDPAPAETALKLPDKPSIVVLPFDNMSGDEEQEYFSDGITEDITTELSRFADLFVIARNTAFTFKGQSHNVQDIASELGVHYVLEGSVRKAGNRVRITAQLIDGQNGNHLWAERYDGRIEEIFDLQDEVTRQVVGTTVPHITAAELAHIRQGDQIYDAAYDLALRAQDDFDRPLKKSASLYAAKAKSYEALNLNERCHRAHYLICMSCWRLLLSQLTDDPEQTRSELRKTAEAYVSLAPNSHRSHFCNGIAKFEAGRNEAAAQDFKHSVELNPNDAMVHGMLAYAEVRLGNLTEAKKTAEIAVRLNPKDRWTGPAYLALAQAAFVEDDHQFRYWADKAIKAQPDAPIRRALMIAYAAEIGDRALLDEHLQHLTAIAPRFIPRLLSGDLDPIKIPEYREKFLRALRKAVPPE
ncbi:MAG: hypothetical protein HN732_11940 [Rhodospirillaceae bacterium]|jgi:adenylate cyclase|nr:hypothetical protein [Rhodospirillaceae bacterium]MBT5192694.1 hypothetical protein [Rhodospirillaceae bacterium]MBT5894337.1 hypothetical protein [Rhodospirillaceae bacterium]MBT7758032.1 hypothetical protein [Rhodospirillaceae bacterium]